MYDTLIDLATSADRQAARAAEFADALAAADDEGADGPPLIVNIELPGFAPQNIRELVAGLADDLASRDGIASAEVFLVRTCEICGCTDMEACLGGCWWTSPTDDICSACAPAPQHLEVCDEHEQAA